MADLYLRQRLSPTPYAHNIVLDGTVAASPTTATIGEVYWRWEDDPTMEPQFLGNQTVGFSVQVPFLLKGRSIRLFLVAKNDAGITSVQNILEAPQIVFTPDPDSDTDVYQLTCSEDIGADNVVNIWDDGGTGKVRQADATDGTRPAHGFVKSSYLNGEIAVVYLGGPAGGSLVGLTPGDPLYLSETAGGVTDTAPAGSGKIVQQVGTAVSSSAYIFEPDEPVELV